MHIITIIETLNRKVRYTVEGPSLEEAKNQAVLGETITEEKLPLSENILQRDIYEIEDPLTLGGLFTGLTPEEAAQIEHEAKKLDPNARETDYIQAAQTLGLEAHIVDRSEGEGETPDLEKPLKGFLVTESVTYKVPAKNQTDAEARFLASADPFKDFGVAITEREIGEE